MLKCLLRKTPLLGLMVVLLEACNPTGDGSDGRQVFRFNDASGILTLDPAFAKDQSHIWATMLFYNGLVRFDDRLKAVPCIASSWEILDSGTTYRFHLRTDVFFHTAPELPKEAAGRKVVADDFVYSLHRLTDPAVASPGRWVMRPVDQDSSGTHLSITAENDSTLLIQLRHPFPPFLSLLAMPYCAVVQKEAVQYFGADFRSHPCGTGPFRLFLWKEGVRLVAWKNDRYFIKDDSGHALPYLDAVEMRFINDKQSAFIEFLKGNLDFLSGLDPSYKDELLNRDGKLQQRHQGRFQLETLPYLNTEYLGILVDTNVVGMRNNPLLHPKVRQALAYGFDKRRMMLFLRNNMGTPGDYGFIPPGLPGFDSTTGYRFDPDRARALLREAGFPGGKGIPEIVLGTTSSYIDLTEYIKSQWEDLGLRIRIDINQAAVHRKLVAEQKLGFFRGSWIADYPDAENYLSLFYSRNAAPRGPNYTHFHDPETDRLYEQAGRTIDDSLRAKLYAEIDRKVMEASPVIILYYDKVVRLRRNNIEGLPPNSMNLLLLDRVRKSAMR